MGNEVNGGQRFTYPCLAKEIMKEGGGLLCGRSHPIPSHPIPYDWLVDDKSFHHFWPFPVFTGYTTLNPACFAFATPVLYKVWGHSSFSLSYLCILSLWAEIGLRPLAVAVSVEMNSHFYDKRTSF